MASESVKLRPVPLSTPGPQGFRNGQLRKKGHFFCLRDCGQFFSSKREEDKHYAGGLDTCENAPPLFQTPEEEFNPLKIQKLKGEEEIEKAKRKAMRIARRLNREEKSFTKSQISAPNKTLSC